MIETISDNTSASQKLGDLTGQILEVGVLMPGLLPGRIQLGSSAILPVTVRCIGNDRQDSQDVAAQHCAHTKRIKWSLCPSISHSPLKSNWLQSYLVRDEELRSNDIACAVRNEDEGLHLRMVPSAMTLPGCDLLYSCLLRVPRDIRNIELETDNVRPQEELRHPEANPK